MINYAERRLVGSISERQTADAESLCLRQLVKELLYDIAATRAADRSVSAEAHASA